MASPVTLSMETLALTRDDGLAVVELDRPPANAIEAGLVDELHETFTALEDDEDVDAVVLTSAVDGFFSGGLDLPALAAYDETAMERFVTGFLDAFRLLHGFGKPLVAALSGHTVAGGAVLAVTADHRVAARGDWTVSMNEIDVGLPVPEPQALVVTDLVGTSGSRDLLLRGRTYTPDEAAEAGLVDEVVPPDALDDRARELARELGGKPSAAFAQIKRAQRQDVLRAFDTRRKRHVDELLTVVRDPETREALMRAAEEL